MFTRATVETLGCAFGGIYARVRFDGESDIAPGGPDLGRSQEGRRTCDDAMERAKAPRNALKPVVIQTSTPVLLVCEDQDQSAVMQLAQALIVGDADPEMIVVQRSNLVQLDISLAAQKRPSIIVPCVPPILEKKVAARA